MKIHLYTMSLNEAEMLGFFFRHYDPWIDRYVVFDDGSTDGTLDLLARHPLVEVRRFQRTCADSFVESARILHDNFWKESRGQADWVVVTAIDEHLQVPGGPMRHYLKHCSAQQTTYVPALGFQMISETFPDPGELLCESRRLGVPSEMMNKLSVFNPDAITETNFEPGRHSARPQGRLQMPDRDELLLLHYKQMGFERTYQRHRFLESGLGSRDFEQGWGHHYSWSRDQLRKSWDECARQSADVYRRDLESSCAPRWWRQTASELE